MVVRSISRSSLVRKIANAIAIAGTLIPLPTASFAGQPETISSYHDPADLVRKAAQNEVKAANDDSAHFLFRGTKTTPQGSITRLYVETKEATAGLVVAYNGKPLTGQQRHEEEARVERFLKNPEELRRKREQEEQNAQRAGRIGLRRRWPGRRLADQIEVPSQSALPTAISGGRGPDRHGGLCVDR